jgi:hypothetical protein
LLKIFLAFGCQYLFYYRYYIYIALFIFIYVSIMIFQYTKFLMVRIKLILKRNSIFELRFNHYSSFDVNGQSFCRLLSLLLFPLLLKYHKIRLQNIFACFVLMVAFFLIREKSPIGHNDNIINSFNTGFYICYNVINENMA